MAHQKSSSEFWYDEQNNRIPYKRTTKVERLMEIESYKLLNEAKKIRKQLTLYKLLAKKVCNEVYEEFMKDKNIEKERKGNYTWYNFDRSIKIEVAISERITFDDLTISAAREKLDQFIDANVEGKVDFVKELVNDAFKTSKGQLDAKKVMGLLRYRSKIKDEIFQEALGLIEAAVRRPESKIYYRVWERDENGKYEAIELNFSNI